MSIMIELETMPEAVAFRQEHLRSLAARPAEIAPGESIRQRAGQALVRFGLWIEGCHPDEKATIFRSLQTTREGLAGSTR